MLRYIFKKNGWGFWNIKQLLESSMDIFIQYGIYIDKSPIFRLNNLRFVLKSRNIYDVNICQRVTLLKAHFSFQGALTILPIDNGRSRKHH